MTKFQPMSVTVFPWLRKNLGDCLFVLTGTDRRALRAAVEIIELYSYDRSPALIGAFATVVKRMQPSTQEFAYHAIAHPMDWQNRAQIWAAAELPELDTLRVCKCEPRYRA